jgi:hypothetical protein
MPTFTLQQDQYEALIELARRGTFDAKGQVIPDSARALNTWLQLIEKQNGITRSSLWIQWQEVDSPVPPTASFPRTWPPELRYFLQLVTRPILRSDVNDVITARARNPVNILVTPDPGAELGWVTLDQYFLVP